MPLSRTKLARTKGLERKTPMPRTTKQMARRKGLSSKPKRYHSAAAITDRAAWKYSHGQRCFVCGMPAQDCHEIIPRSKTDDWCHRANLFGGCRFCHDRILVWLPIVVQCALKFIADKTHFDLSVINRLRGRAVNAITYEEVKSWVESIKAMRGTRER